MQLNPLNSNHITPLQHNGTKEVTHNSNITTVQEGTTQEETLAEKSRIAKVFISLTQELTNKERTDREAVLQQTLRKGFQEKDLDFSMTQAPQVNGADTKSSEKEDSEIIASLSTPTELKGFLNEFYTLYNSGYTPVDLKI